MSIKVAGLTKNYGAQKAVDNISFNIGKGEIVGFLGPNGAGKSTTMKILTGYIAADGGLAEVCDERVGTQSIATKEKIGYLPETNPLYTEMYVREYLEFIFNIHFRGRQNRKALGLEPATRIPFSEKIEIEKIDEIIKLVGLAPEANKKIGQLSKGYKQRTGLAAALIHDPEVLILDEPTSGLDPNQIVEIREVIKNLGKNKTVLFSSHILQEVQAICDRVIIINKGKIVADATLSDLQNRNSSQHSILVSFKEDITIETLRDLKQITDIEHIGMGSYKISTGDPETVRKQLVELSLKNNLNIVSLQSESNSLEDIFRSLTSLTN